MHRDNGNSWRSHSTQREAALLVVSPAVSDYISLSFTCCSTESKKDKEDKCFCCFKSAQTAIHLVSAQNTNLGWTAFEWLRHGWSGHCLQGWISDNSSRPIKNSIVAESGVRRWKSRGGHADKAQLVSLCVYFKDWRGIPAALFPWLPTRFHSCHEWSWHGSISEKPWQSSWTRFTDRDTVLFGCFSQRSLRGNKKKSLSVWSLYRIILLQPVDGRMFWSHHKKKTWPRLESSEPDFVMLI